MHHAAVQYASHDASAFIGYLQYDTLKFSHHLLTCQTLWDEPTPNQNNHRT